MIRKPRKQAYENALLTTVANVELPAGAAPARREHVPLGIIYMLAATILFACSSAASKWLVRATQSVKCCFCARSARSP
jgi:hypothetical protein